MSIEAGFTCRIAKLRINSALINSTKAIAISAVASSACVRLPEAGTLRLALSLSALLKSARSWRAGTSPNRRPVRIDGARVNLG